MSFGGKPKTPPLPPPPAPVAEAPKRVNDATQRARDDERIKARQASTANRTALSSGLEEANTGRKTLLGQ